MYLGIEIGGTKLQLGVARPRCQLEAIERAAVRPADGAEGIRRQIAELARPLIERHQVRAIGIGFGGPVDMAAGRVVKSHHVAGWERLSLGRLVPRDVRRCRPAGQRFRTWPAWARRDSGPGRGRRVVFYTNVGSGIGGALVVNGRVYVGAAGIASEIGHFRPGPQAQTPREIVELAASGWAIAHGGPRRGGACGRTPAATCLRGRAVDRQNGRRSGRRRRRSGPGDLSPGDASLWLGDRAGNLAAFARSDCCRRRGAAGRREVVLCAVAESRRPLRIPATRPERAKSSCRARRRGGRLRRVWPWPAPRPKTAARGCSFREVHAVWPAGLSAVP